MNIEGKKIFITGSTGGIGKAICNKFLNKNCNLVLSSSSNEKLDKLRRLYGNKHSYYNLDLSNIDNLEKNMRIISKEHNDIDVLVNNAGVTNDALLLRMKYSQWSKVINTNLSSNFVIIKSILPSMISKRSGKIIGISSVVALIIVVPSLINKSKKMSSKIPFGPYIIFATIIYFSFSDIIKNILIF